MYSSLLVIYLLFMHYICVVYAQHLSKYCLCYTIHYIRRKLMILVIKRFKCCVACNTYIATALLACSIAIHKKNTHNR